MSRDTNGITYLQYFLFVNYQLLTYKQYPWGSNVGTELQPSWESISGPFLGVGETVTVSIEIDGDTGGRLGGSFTVPSTTTTTGSDQSYSQGSGTVHAWSTNEEANYTISGQMTW